MVQVSRSKDCGNSPKNQFSESIAIALELGDVDFISGVVEPDCLWEQPSGTLSTTEGIIKALNRLPEVPYQLDIDHVVTHGKSGAVNGSAMLEGGGCRRFCHVIEFSSTKCVKVKRLISYSDSVAQS